MGYYLQLQYNTMRIETNRIEFIERRNDVRLRTERAITNKEMERKWKWKKDYIYFTTEGRKKEKENIGIIIIITHEH